MINDLSPEPTMPFMNHLVELRQRLLWCVAVFIVMSGLSYCYAEQIFLFLVRPLTHLYPEASQHRLIYTGLAEAFVTYVKVALFSGAFLTLPLLAMHIWRFIAPGLYAHERRLFQYFLWATPLLFLAGALFAYYIVIPNAWAFFTKFENLRPLKSLPIQFEARLSEYLSTTLQIIFAFGTCFLLPIILLLLARIGVLNRDLLCRGRRYAFILILIASAVFTPPDVLSMVCLATPLYFLYEVSIILLKFLYPPQPTVVG